MEKLYTSKTQLGGEPREITYNTTDGERITEAGTAMMRDRYTFGDEQVPLDCLLRAACAYSDSSAHAQRLYNYWQNCWAFPATPVLSNGGTPRGLPISCFINAVGDSINELGDHYAENLKMSTAGGGIGSDWSAVRSVGTSTSRGNRTTGVIPFIKTVDSLTLSAFQGATRRGATAVYLSVAHPEIEEFLDVRKPTGDVNRRCMNIHNAVSIPDAFMEAVEAGAEWDLIDPHTKLTVKTVDARDIWMRILKLRVETGEPYLFFEDTANNALPDHLKALGKRINSSNLCTEIMLPTSPEETAVCCLSSLNLEYFEEWKETSIIEDMLRMLDNALECFAKIAPPEMHRSIKTATEERSVGLGAMGFHDLLMSKNVPFESAMASAWNVNIFKHIKQECERVNLVLGDEKGEAPLAKGTGKRFSHTNAIAPNASISILCGETSPSIEPRIANAATRKTQSGVFLIKNKHLDKVLRQHYTEAEIEDIWSNIITNGGSVQHLEGLPDEVKEVFKTASEIDQQFIIVHAGVRQKYIDQGQSVNLFVQPGISTNYLHGLHKLAWEKGLKSLYYCYSESVGSTDKINEEISDCIACEG